MYRHLQVIYRQSTFGYSPIVPKVYPLCSCVTAYPDILTVCTKTSPKAHNCCFLHVMHKDGGSAVIWWHTVLLQALGAQRRQRTGTSAYLSHLIQSI